MSTQHTGDGPPGDDDYYDPVEEENNRPSGSGTNINAAAWDPEKMELHRIVHRLLALEERRALPAQPILPASPVEHAVPHRVKLPAFWEKDAAAWFRLAEAVMGDSHVVEESVMYRTVILHIPHHVLERARGILSLADTAEFPFTELKNRLVELLTPSILDRCTGILRGAELGGRRPTELLEVLMAALPPDEPAGHLFKTCFLHKLPGDLKDLVAVQFHQLGVVELARYADVIWDARNSKKTVVAAVQPATVEEDTAGGEETALDRAVAALTIHAKKTWGGSKSRGGGRSGGGGGGGRGGKSGQRKRNLCEKHERYGKHAHFCADPETCSWSGNE